MTAQRTSASGDAARAFVLRLGRGLHSYGYPAHRLEDALTLVSRRLGLEGQFFSMPTALFASFDDADEHRTFQIRVDPGAVNLEKLARLDAVTGEVARGELAPETGSHRLDEIFASAPPYGPALTTLCFALASGAASRFFGGGAAEALVSTLVGLAIGLLALLTSRSAAVGRIFEPLAATTAALLATLATRAAGPYSVYTATLAGLIVLIPGLPLTTAMTELATRHLVSGTTRLAGTCGTFLVIGFGVALGSQLGRQVVGDVVAAAPTALPSWTEWLALVLAPLAFTVLLQAQARDAGWILAAGALAFGGARAGGTLLGPELGAFVGALIVGVGSNLYSRVVGRPAAVTLVPGILLLVPGSIGFSSLSSLLERNTVPGVEAAFRMTLVAVSLATGLLFANVLLPERTLLDAKPGQ